MKKTLLSLMCTLGLLCGCGDAAESAAAASATAADKQTVYRVAAEIDLPFTVQGPNGTIDGFDYELLKAIGAQHGFDVQFEAHSRSGMFEALAGKQADIVASGIYLNDERKTRFEATEPYMESGTVFLVREGTGINGLGGMAGKRIAVKGQTVAEGLVKTVLGEDNYSVHPTLWLAFKDLMTGRADAVLGDEASLRHYAQEYPEEKLVLLDNLNRPREHYVFLVQKGNKPLLDKLNKGLAQARADGTYQRLHSKWFEGKPGHTH